MKKSVKLCRIPITLCHVLCYISLIIYIKLDRHHSRNATSIILSSLRHFIPKREIRKLTQLDLEQETTPKLEREEKEAFGKKRKTENKGKLDATQENNVNIF